jgi:hypothetical protein
LLLRRRADADRLAPVSMGQHFLRTRHK